MHRHTSASTDAKAGRFTTSTGATEADSPAAGDSPVPGAKGSPAGSLASVSATAAPATASASVPVPCPAPAAERIWNTPLRSRVLGLEPHIAQQIALHAAVGREPTRDPAALHGDELAPLAPVELAGLRRLAAECTETHRRLEARCFVTVTVNQKTRIYRYS